MTQNVWELTRTDKIVKKRQSTNNSILWNEGINVYIETHLKMARICLHLSGIPFNVELVETLDSEDLDELRIPLMWFFLE